MDYQFTFWVIKNCPSKMFDSEFCFITVLWRDVDVAFLMTLIHLLQQGSICALASKKRHTEITHTVYNCKAECLMSVHNILIIFHVIYYILLYYIFLWLHSAVKFWNLICQKVLITIFYTNRPDSSSNCNSYWVFTGTYMAHDLYHLRLIKQRKNIYNYWYAYVFMGIIT